MIRVFGLQRGDQEFKLRKAAQTCKGRILQEERPAGEPSADAPLKPLKGSFAPSRQSESASDLIIRMVGMSKGFRTRTGSGHTSDGCFSVPHQGIEQTL